MTDTKELQNRIDASGLKQEYIASYLGLSSYGFARKKNNESEFKPSEIDALCSLLKINSIEERFAIFFKPKVELNETTVRDGHVTRSNP